MGIFKVLRIVPASFDMLAQVFANHFEMLLDGIAWLEMNLIFIGWRVRRHVPIEVCGLDGMHFGWR